MYFITSQKTTTKIPKIPNKIHEFNLLLNMQNPFKIFD
ncbi:hypothetical protein OUS_1432 [Helicobacter pylori R056a]|nr:hypothetical protein OUS_1432 [Helicobacter pylori R056a]